MNSGDAIKTMIFIITLIIVVGVASLIINTFLDMLYDVGGRAAGGPFWQLWDAFHNSIGILSAVVVLAVVALLVTAAMRIIKLVRQEAGVRE
ncbi:MAG: hypothetical protein QXT13_10150 [Pyrobaculum sp.]